MAFRLTVDGKTQVERNLGRSTGSAVLLIGRGSKADLQCPEDLTRISRDHAAVTYAHSKLWVEDRNSANGTWLQKADGTPVRLAAGEPIEIGRGDTIWLDEDHRATVTSV